MTQPENSKLVVHLRNSYFVSNGTAENFGFNRSKCYSI